MKSRFSGGLGLGLRAGLFLVVFHPFATAFADSVPATMATVQAKVGQKLAILNKDALLLKRKIALEVADVSQLPYGPMQHIRVKVNSQTLKEAENTRWELDSFSYLIANEKADVESTCDDLGNYVCEPQIPRVAVLAVDTGPRALKVASDALEKLEIAQRWREQGKRAHTLVARFDARVHDSLRETWYFIFGLEPDVVEERAMIAVDVTDMQVLWSSPKK